MKIDNYIFIAFLLIVVNTFSASANTRSETIATLKSKTTIPVKFPKMLPNSVDYDTHLYVSANSNYYDVSFDYTSDCHGSTACTMGSFSANKDIQIELKSSYSQNDTYKHIKLYNGYSAIFINSCGAYCMAVVQWKINGVVYAVNLKNGTEAEAIKIANSVYD